MTADSSAAYLVLQMVVMKAALRAGNLDALMDDCMADMMAVRKAV